MASGQRRWISRSHSVRQSVTYSSQPVTSESSHATVTQPKPLSLIWSSKCVAVIASDSAGLESEKCELAP